jgi:hypothetical protein
MVVTELHLHRYSAVYSCNNINTVLLFLLLSYSTFYPMPSVCNRMEYNTGYHTLLYSALIYLLYCTLIHCILLLAITSRLVYTYVTFRCSYTVPYYSTAFLDAWRLHCIVKVTVLYCFDNTATTIISSHLIIRYSTVYCEREGNPYIHLHTVAELNKIHQLV